jgi:Secretion system C-terminal sorting domain
MKKKYLLLLVVFSTSINAQNIISVSPNNGSLGQQLNVTLSGSNFYAVSGANNVSFVNDLFETLQINSVNQLFSFPEQLVVNLTIPSTATLGFYDIKLSNPDPAFNVNYTLNNGFLVNNALGISNFDSNHIVQVYPNPVKEDINVVIPKEFLNESNCIIYDINGKEAFKYDLKNLKTNINISKLKSGNYILKTFNKSNVYTKKFVKK